MAQFKSPSARWEAVVTRNSLADGKFVYCVKTTKIYCRPICKARLARRANVEFHDTPADAEDAGYRACKRCKPELATYDPHLEIVAKAKRTIERAGADSARPTLKTLAREAKLSEWHFHRVFTSVTGVTPKAYGRSVSNEVSSASSSSEHGSAELQAYPDWNDGSISITESFDFGPPPDTPFPTPVANTSQGALEAVPASQQLPLKQLPKEIVYTIQPSIAQFVLIASTRDGICALEMGGSESELLELLWSRFPLSLDYYLSACNGDIATDSASVHNYAFTSVMNALTNPSDQMLNLTFDTELISLDTS
jgi:methylphosphotriester-DNA--protein-cysteine methyltransferase